MILTDYYRFDRLATKAKTRLDCTASTQSYPTFEENRATRTTQATEKRDATNEGDLIVYYNDLPKTFSGEAQRKADKSMTMKGKNLSSVFVPDPASNYAYGDINGTGDAVMLVFHDFTVTNGVIQQGAAVELFIARGKEHEQIAVYNLLCDGELDEEMNLLRGRASKQQ
jgi:hypothetical protein